MTATFPCAVCGEPVRRRPATRTRPRHVICERCGYVLHDYPRVAAGVLLLRGDSVLLLRRAHPPRIGRLDVPGGFLEAGETFEGNARRELHEETGLRVPRLEPLGTYWDTYFIRGFGRFPVMNVYFVGRWTRGTPVAADDAASAEWIALDALSSLRSHYAWAHMSPLFADLKTWASRAARAARGGGGRARARRRT